MKKLFIHDDREEEMQNVAFFFWKSLCFHFLLSFIFCRFCRVMSSPFSLCVCLWSHFVRSFSSWNVSSVNALIICFHSFCSRFSCARVLFHFCARRIWALMRCSSCSRWAIPFSSFFHFFYILIRQLKFIFEQFSVCECKGNTENAVFSIFHFTNSSHRQKMT